MHGGRTDIGPRPAKTQLKAVETGFIFEAET